MKNKIAYAAFLAACLTVGGPARAQPAFGVLPPGDVKTYSEILRAQDAGQFAKADALIAGLSDRALMGHVLLQRYMGRGWHATFPELQAWLEAYADHPGADRIEKLALKRKPSAQARVASAIPRRWRGGGYDNAVDRSGQFASALGRRYQARIQDKVNAGESDAARAILSALGPAGDLPRGDIDLLTQLVAASYLAQGDDETAYGIAGGGAAAGRANAPLLDWTAGLAAYRLKRFDAAGDHFERLAKSQDINAATRAGAAFWAARARMKDGKPEAVVPLLTRAAVERHTFYGMLASRLLGANIAASFAQAELDERSFARIVAVPGARRAVALWQIGRRDDVAVEMLRAFGELDPALDPAFSALARALGLPGIELRAAETSAGRNVYLTGLFPVPLYEPKGGYWLDKSLVLAFARQESRFVPGAVSRTGARGLMQVMPSTAAYLEKDPALAGKGRERLDDPAFNLMLGQKYLSSLLDQFGGDLFKVLAAYNAGPTNLQRWCAARPIDIDPLLFIESLPSPETRVFIERVMMYHWMYRIRLGEPVPSLDAAAAGNWPVYAPYARVSMAD